MVRRARLRNDHLRLLEITDKTRRRFLHPGMFLSFFKYLRALRGRQPRSFEALDVSLAEYIHHLYQEGDHISLAGWTIGGLCRFFARCKLLFLPHSCLTAIGFNWQRVHLPQRTIPISWLGAKAMAAAAWKVGRPDLAFLVLIGFAFLLRTMELISLYLYFHHVRLFRDHGMVVIATIKSKTSRGLQPSLSLMSSMSPLSCGARSSQKVKFSLVQWPSSVLPLQRWFNQLDWRLQIIFPIAFAVEEPPILTTRRNLWVGPWSRGTGNINTPVASMSTIRGLLLCNFYCPPCPPDCSHFFLSSGDAKVTCSGQIGLGVG